MTEETTILRHKEDEYTEVTSEVRQQQDGTFHGITRKRINYPHGAENNRRHLEREAGNLKLAGQKQLPVIGFISADSEKGEIVTEYFPGEPLKDLLLRVDIGMDRRAGLIRSALGVLGEFHDGGIKHFDPHLGNFLVNHHGEKLVVCDLGLSFSQEFPHLVPPPTDVSAEHFSDRQNRAIRRSYVNSADVQMLNELDAKDDLFVFATDLIRLLPEETKALETGVYRVIRKMQKGRYNTVAEAIRELPQPTPRAGHLPPQSLADNYGSLSRIKLRHVMIALSLATILLAGGYSVSRINSAQKTPSENAVPTPTSITAAPLVTAVPQVAIAVAPKAPKIEVRKPETHSPSIPPSPLSVSPRQEKNTVKKRALPPAQTKETAPPPRKQTPAPKLNTKPAPSRQEKLQTELLASAKEHVIAGKYTNAYRQYIKAKDSGADCSAEIANLEQKVKGLLSSNDIAARSEGAQLLRAVADQPGENPKAKYYTALAFHTGQFGEKNLALARHYYELAEENGHPEAAKGLRRLRKQMEN